MNDDYENDLPETSEDEQVQESETTPQTVEVTVTAEERPFLSTNFQDYSVTEGLLLLLLLLFFISAVARILRRAFSWLL